jgi:uncharacterized ion transporter superfamily protein YfcC
MLAATGVRFDVWMRFVGPILAVLIALALAAIGTAVALGV